MRFTAVAIGLVDSAWGIATGTQLEFGAGNQVRPRCDFIFHLGRVLAIPGALAAAAACGHSLCVPCAKRRGYLRNRMR